MMDDQNSIPSQGEQRQFTEHLRQASDIVRSWPAWKQTVLGGSGGLESGRTQSISGNASQSGMETGIGEC